MAEDRQLLPGLLRLSCGDGWREGRKEARKGAFCITCIVLAFFTRYYLNFLLVYNLCRKRGILKPVI